MTKHTPGEWEAMGSESTLATWVRGDGGRICTMRQSEQDWPNARLIAAAPELLATLEALLLSEDDTKPGARERHAEKRKQARAAIAKATS